jgi:transmembrane sensor
MSTDKNKITEDILKTWEVPHANSKEDSWNAIQNKIENANPPVIQINKSWVWKLSAAAAIILVLVVWRLNSSSETQIQSFNSIAELSLPDGSRVSLNAGSQLSYSEDGWNEERKVSLEGEAYFDVVKGGSFTVETDNGSIEVVGTEFNVFSRQSDFEVGCFEGKVKVRNSANEVLLLPGQMTESLSGNKLEALQFWLNGQFNWDDSDLLSVFQELERQYGVTFILPDLKGRKYTGSFKKAELNNVLNLICEPMNLGFELEQNNSVVVTNKIVVN